MSRKPCAGVLDFAQQRCTSKLRLARGTGGELMYAAAYDIMRLAGQTGGHASRLRKYMACVKDHGMELRAVDRTWTGSEFREELGGSSVYMATWDNLKRLVCYMLRRNMKPETDIVSICELFDIPQSQFESAFVAMPEKDTLQSIARAIPFPSKSQFHVGDYRIDLYFPDLRIAVECNENGHESYDRDDERERRSFIRQQLSCRFIEYDPFQPGFSVLNVICQIVELLVSPEFQLWNKIQSRGPWRLTESQALPGRPEESQQIASEAQLP